MHFVQSEQRKQRIGDTMGPPERQMTKQAAAKVYERKYGVPSRSAKFVAPTGEVVEVLKWTEQKTGEGVTIYATLGSSFVLGDSDRTCEFFIGLTPDADDVVAALAEVALDGNGTKNIPGVGDSITLAYPLWKGTEMRSFLFTDGHELIPSLTETVQRIDFIKLVPLFSSELEFKRQFGDKALWEKFESMAIPYWDPHRSAAL
jgi:hypothetical protein